MQRDTSINQYFLKSGIFTTKWVPFGQVCFAQIAVLTPLFYVWGLNLNCAVYAAVIKMGIRSWNTFRKENSFFSGRKGIFENPSSLLLKTFLGESGFQLACTKPRFAQGKSYFVNLAIVVNKSKLIVEATCAGKCSVSEFWNSKILYSHGTLKLCLCSILRNSYTSY